jgi:hypothetical protein
VKKLFYTVCLFHDSLKTPSQSLSHSVFAHMQSKVGSLWLRLSVDCAHLHSKALALWVSNKALENPHLPLHSLLKMKQRVVFFCGKRGSDKGIDNVLIRLKSIEHTTIQVNVMINVLKCVLTQYSIGYIVDSCCWS